MTDILLTILFASLCSMGAYVAARFTDYEQFDDNPEYYRDKPVRGKMILWWLRYYGSYLPEFYRKPVYLCMTCMGSLWSLPASAVYTHIVIGDMWHLVYVWPLVTLATAGLNSLIAFNLKMD